MSNLTKYNRIVHWARRRYTINGWLIIDTGGVKSVYGRIENAAFEKYLRLPRDAEGHIVFA